MVCKYGENYWRIPISNMPNSITTKTASDFRRLFPFVRGTCGCSFPKETYVGSLLTKKSGTSISFCQAVPQAGSSWSLCRVREPCLLATTSERTNCWRKQWNLTDPRRIPRGNRLRRAPTQQGKTSLPAEQPSSLSPAIAHQQPLLQTKNSPQTDYHSQPGG